MEAKPDLLNLDLEAEMIVRVGSSLKRVKKRLVDADLTFQLMPHVDADPLEVSTWEAKIHALIGHRDTMSFPQLLDFKRAFNQRRDEQQAQESANATARRGAHTERLKKGAEAAVRLKALQAGKTYGVTSSFGGKVAGEPLRTIDNYSGLNTIYNHQPRTLVRRDGRFTKVDAVSVVPPWLSAGCYPNADPASLRDPPEGVYTLPFKVHRLLPLFRPPLPLFTPRHPPSPPSPPSLVSFR